MSDAIVWQDPPPARLSWRARFAALTERPGEWGRFGPYALESRGKQLSYVSRVAVSCGYRVEATSRAEGHEGFIYVRVLSAPDQVFIRAVGE